MEPVPALRGDGSSTPLVDGLPKQPGASSGGARQVGGPLQGRPRGRLRHRCATASTSCAGRGERAAATGGAPRSRRSSGSPGPKVLWPSGGRPSTSKPVEVRVATGASLHLGDERLVGRSAEQHVQLVAGPGAVERPERAARRGTASGGRPPASAARGGRHPDLVAPQRQQHSEAPVARPGEDVHEYVERGLVGPLDVVDDERPPHDRAQVRSSHCVERLGRPTASRARAVVSAGAPRRPAGAGARSAAGIRGTAVALIGRHTPRRTSTSCVGLGADAVDEPCLADPGVTADEQGRPCARPRGLEHRPDPFDSPGSGRRNGRARRRRATWPPSQCGTRARASS